MNRAKSTRRVMLLARMGSPTCRLHTGRPWLSPLRARFRARRSTGYRWRTPAGTLRPGHRGLPPGPACQPSQDSNLPLQTARVDIVTVTRDVPPAGKHQPRALRRVVEHRLSRLGRVPVHARGTSTVRTPTQPATALLMTSRSSVAPGTTVMRPVNASSFVTTCSRHTPTTSYPRSSACLTMYWPSFPEAPTMQTFITHIPPFAGRLWLHKRGLPIPHKIHPSRSSRVGIAGVWGVGGDGRGPELWLVSCSGQAGRWRGPDSRRSKTRADRQPRLDPDTARAITAAHRHPDLLNPRRPPQPQPSALARRTTCQAQPQPPGHRQPPRRRQYSWRTSPGHLRALRHGLPLGITPGGQTAGLRGRVRPLRSAC
jgi:hypothetical protein